MHFYVLLLQLIFAGSSMLHCSLGLQGASSGRAAEQQEPVHKAVEKPPGPWKLGCSKCRHSKNGCRACRPAAAMAASPAASPKR